MIHETTRTKITVNTNNILCQLMSLVRVVRVDRIVYTKNLLKKTRN